MPKKITLGILFSLILISPAMLGMEARAAESSEALPEIKTYDQLRHAISEARAGVRVRVEKAVEQERVREAWEIGRLIDAHVLQHKERADYDQQVISRLAGDLGMSDSELYRMLEFYRAYPIFAHARQLSWSEYRELLSVNDPKEREVLAERTEKESWNRERLRREVKNVQGGRVPLEETLVSPTPEPGKVGTYRIVKATVGPETGQGVIDLGFSNYYKTSKDLRFKEGAIIEATPPFGGGGSAPSDLIKLSKRTSADLYTYRAYVVRVLDGDTLEVVVDLGFGVRSVQTLRLRGIDAPELITRDGVEAKEFVQSSLAKLIRERQPLLIKTVKSDKYDRYLADIFYTDKAGKSQYLNNRLLEEGHAVRVRE